MAAARLLSRRGLSAARRPLGDATLAVHGDRPSVEGYSTAHDVAPPLSVSTTFHAGGTHIYGRLSNPGVTRAEAMLGKLEAGPSGAAAHAVLYVTRLRRCCYHLLVRPRAPATTATLLLFLTCYYARSAIVRLLLLLLLLPLPLLALLPTH